MYQAKKTGKTQAGNKYIILQDGPKSFHISVGVNDHVIYDHLHDPSNLEDIYSKIKELEDELLNRHV